MAIIRTVRGDIPADALGLTYLHEHILTLPPPGVTDRTLEMSDEAAMTAAVAHFARAGGSAIVEMTPRDYGRMPGGLERISAATGVHIIAVTGWIKQASYTTWAQGRSVHDIAGEMIRDIVEGMPDLDGTPTRICAGIIKAGSSLNTITPDERLVLQAAAIAHRETGAAVSTHTERGTMGIEQAQILIEGGVPPERILIGHCDHNLNWDYHLRLAHLGVTLGYDQISKEKYAPDAERIAFIKRMIEAGFADQIALSMDLARTVYFPECVRWGSPGFTYILWRFAPRLIEEGVDPALIERMLIATPRRLLAIEN
ncbi:MAG: phosphotriesterase family protein [Candidatus Flexifilum sp.]|jgi:phosphotriesterase-related protein